MAAEPQPCFWDTVTTWAAKLWPGLAGAVVALRWLPVETTRVDRAIAAVGGFAAAANIGPALAEVSGVASVRVEAGIVFAVGLFGMASAGEAIRARGTRSSAYSLATGCVVCWEVAMVSASTLALSGDRGVLVGRGDRVCIP